MQGHGYHAWDWIFITVECEEHFSNVSHSLLPWPASDHSLIFPDIGGLRSGKPLLGFANM